jgi:hypothetical protein
MGKQTGLRVKMLDCKNELEVIQRRKRLPWAFTFFAFF